MYKGKQSLNEKRKREFSILASELLGKYYSEAIPDTELSGVYYDTRRMKDGGVFVCINGADDDGHRYARRAAELGARVIIAERRVAAEVPVILTDSTREALAYLAARLYKAPPLRLFGVTGTNGKTTTTHFIASILEADGVGCGIIGTNGSYFAGEPLSVASDAPTTPSLPELYALLAEAADRGAKAAALEVSSHALVQGRVSGLEFETGVFTNLSREHLDYHGTMEAYFAAKSRLFGICRRCVANADDEYGRRLIKQRSDVVGFGISNGDVTARNIRQSRDKTEFELDLFGRVYPAKIRMPGEFAVYNALAAAAACAAGGACDESIVEGLWRLSGVCGRLERVYSGEFDVIIDYAHTPDGLAKVLCAVRKTTQGRLICVFGCGGDRDRSKRAPMGGAATEIADVAIITSDNPRTEPPTEIIIDILTGVKKDNYIVIENRGRAISAAVTMAHPGDTVLLCGKGQERYQVIGREKRHFDEREIVRKILDEQKG